MNKLIREYEMSLDNCSLPYQDSGKPWDKSVSGADQVGRRENMVFPWLPTLYFSVAMVTVAMLL